MSDLEEIMVMVKDYARRMKCLEQAVVEIGPGFGRVFERALELYYRGEPKEEGKNEL